MTRIRVPYIMDRERQVVKKLIDSHHAGILQEWIFSNTIFLYVFVMLFCVCQDHNPVPHKPLPRKNDIISRLTYQLLCRSIRAEQTAEPSQG